MKKFNLTWGSGNFDKTGKKSNQTWDVFCKKIKDAPTSIADSDAARKKEKGNSDWFIFGKSNGVLNSRDVVNREGLVIDIDSGPKDIVARIKDMALLKPYQWIIHHSYSSTVEQPKIHLIIPLSEAINLEAFEALSTLVCYLIGRKYCDVIASRRPSGLMYMPMKTKEQPTPFFIENSADDDKRLDGLVVLNTFWADQFSGEWENRSTWPKDVTDTIKAEREERVRGAFEGDQSDPRLKEGAVGSFCRAYTIQEAILKFIPEHWQKETADIPDEMETRWLHSSSTSGEAGGVVRTMEGNTGYGKVRPEECIFFFSHHASDPYCERLLNAFDMVRLHKFGELDSRSKATKDEKLPSYKNMLELVASDDKCLLEKHAHSTAGFDLVPIDVEPMPVDTEEETKGKKKKNKKKEKDKKQAQVDDSENKTSEETRNDLVQVLAYKNDGSLVNSESNLIQIMNHAFNVKETFGFNVKSQFCVCLKTLRVKIERGDATIFQSVVSDDDVMGTQMTDQQYLELTNIIQLSYNFGDSALKSSMIRKVFENEIRKHQFDPFKRYLDTLPDWDGKKRVAGYFSTYVAGVKKTKYTKAISRHFLTCVVSNAFGEMTPAAVMPVVEGKEGIGKSSCVNELLPYHEMFVSLGNDQWQSGGTRLIESIVGGVIVELEEFDASNERHANQLKRMLTLRNERTRFAYDRDVTTVDRSWVFYATTNPNPVLADELGARRFAPIRSKSKSNPKTAPQMVRQLMKNRDQIWAEAVVLYQAKGVVQVPLDTKRKKAVQESTPETLKEQIIDTVTTHLHNTGRAVIAVSCLKAELWHDKIPSISTLDKWITIALKNAGWKSRGDRIKANENYTISVDKIDYHSKRQRAWVRKNSAQSII